MIEEREPVEVIIDEIIIDKSADKTTAELTEEGHLVIRAPHRLSVRELDAAVNDTAMAAGKSLELGAKMADGSVYAGLTADGKSRIFAMPEDLDVTMTFNNAAKAVKKLNSQKALGHDDWQIPLLENLRVLQKNQNEGALKGTFKTASSRGSGYPHWYWSSTEFRDALDFVHLARFTDCHETWNHKDYDGRRSCRPVRLVTSSAPAP
ncbi:MAG: DUF1566 domain-containing protein [Alphaproteobacteria bacterium]|nr:DUF1566 domain-containing protein [Alphaproteobacteria bacterium]